MTDHQTQHSQEPTDASSTVGKTAEIVLLTISERPLPGKVDTGATTSCLHATNIRCDNNEVSFVCEALSENIITLPLAGKQTVQSANHDGDTRPVVVIDVSINGKHVDQVAFNLNDRTGMDSPILIGENLLSQGGFVVDVDKDQELDDNQQSKGTTEGRLELISRGIQALVEAELSHAEVIGVMKTLLRNQYDERY